MSRFDAITEKFEAVKYMDETRARVLRDVIMREDARDILEIGFFRGKSSLYIAAILEDLGRGRLLTIDRQSAQRLKPNIHDLLAAAGLSHRVEPVFAFRSFTWELQKLLAAGPRPQFDLCYFDGGHTWDETGFGFLLVDRLLRPGGVIIFDDLDWSVRRSQAYKKNPEAMAAFSPDEAAAKTVRLVWDLLAPGAGYAQVEEVARFGWGVARKPGGPEAAAQPAATEGAFHA
jgi:predicted O-methyltransferase YrrM